MLGFSKGQVITLMKKGKLQHCKLLGKYYTTETAVDSLIDNLMKMQVV